MYVFVLDKNKKPLMPCHASRARLLLKNKKAAVFRRSPFTIILKEREGGKMQPIRVKVDPGSKTSGIAVTVLRKKGETVIFGANIEHRGEKIKDSLDSRRGCRRGRRSRNTRYRTPRFNNRTRKPGWLPPSILSRVENIDTWIKRIFRVTSATQISLEHAKFDMQLMENPAIQGIEYQRGTLAGFELREYLLLKHKHTCMYCGGESKDPVLNIEHFIPRNPVKGEKGSNKLSNLGISCVACNKAKDNARPKDWAEMLRKSRKSIDKKRFKAVIKRMEQKNTSYNHAAVLNTTRNEIKRRLEKIAPVECGTGGQTKFNRTNLGLLKDHWIDASCVGNSGANILIDDKVKPIQIKATGHGCRQFCRVDKYGFPRTKTKSRNPFVFGFKTGDIVKAVVIKGKKAGVYIGRIAVRASGYFNISTDKGLVTGISYKQMTKVMSCDGYIYNPVKA